VLSSVVVGAHAVVAGGNFLQGVHVAQKTGMVSVDSTRRWALMQRMTFTLMTVHSLANCVD